MIEKIGTGSMSREAWNTLRRGSLGGSDAPAVLGVSAFKSPFALWCEKTGKLPPPGIADRESVRLGADLESYVAQRFSEVSGKKLARVNFTIKNSDYPFAHANIDRRVIGERAGFEAKTSSSWEIAADCRAGELPAAWRAQCMHYLMVTGWERWYLAVLCFGQGLFRFVIDRSESEIAALAAAELSFWTLVETGTPPETDGSETTAKALEQLYGESEPCVTDLSAAAPQLREYERLEGQIRTLSERRDACRAAIQQVMGPAERGQYGKYLVTWKSQPFRRLDRASFENECGAIPEKFFRVSRTRPFRLTVRQEVRG